LWIKALKGFIVSAFFVSAPGMGDNLVVKVHYKPLQ